MLERLALIAASVRDAVLKVIGAPRSIIPGIDPAFDNPPARYDVSRDVVTFQGKELGGVVNCAVSRKALDDHFGVDGLGQEGRVKAFLKNRSKIEQIATRQIPLLSGGGARCRPGQNLQRREFCATSPQTKVSLPSSSNSALESNWPVGCSCRSRSADTRQHVSCCSSLLLALTFLRLFCRPLALPESSETVRKLVSASGEL
ncbi:MULTISPECIES: DUF1488 domain-containing protein [unclassified Bradyrhizobium]